MFKYNLCRCTLAAATRIFNFTLDHVFYLLLKRLIFFLVRMVPAVIWKEKEKRNDTQRGRFLKTE